ELYRRALKVNSRWDEGWWYLATLLYERDRYAEAADAFARAAELQPKVGGPRAMLALCEFRLGRYDDAFRHIQQARRLGVVDNPELVRVLRYHESLLLLLRGEFEIAQQNLDAMAFEGVESESLTLALGLAVLRVRAVPSLVPPGAPEHELIRRAGSAALQSARRNTADAQREFERLAADFPKTPNVHYAHGRYLLAHRDDEGALAAFQRELENSPDSVMARLQIAYIRLKNKEPAAGLPFAEEAVKLSRSAPMAHYLLGRLLFDTGENARAIEQLETAQRLAPEEPKVHFALSRAYAKANRKADAARARETFLRLNKKLDEANAAARAKGETANAGGDVDEP
ncbi:MAG TPA: tetratricopeptide repeat protein, partial [Pyrinomonadaceae bacterium]|nr:tetratricopeptide repeat protein [Pyrinomonadaceae bacterium]